MEIKNKTEAELKTLLQEVENELKARGAFTKSEWLTLEQAIKHAREYPKAKFESVKYPIDQDFYPYTIKEDRLCEIYEDGYLQEVSDSHLLEATFRIIED